MPIDEPGWWYGTGAPAMASLLRPVASLYGRVAVARYRRTAPYRSRLPVLCIGNLVAGGTGKTPLALHIARLLQARGGRPAFLSRGHGGRITGPHQVAPERDLARDVGDEPLLLARVAPTVVARDRAAGARLIELGLATHILMDDGLQNPALHKDLSLAVVDGQRWIGNGLLIPAGPLRAPLGFQAGLVDALVVGVQQNGTGTLDIPIALAEHFRGPVIAVQREVDCDTDWLGERPWIAFAGIGRPEGFFALLARHGARIAEAVRFADHHAFTDRDARHLLHMAFDMGAGLVTTEKDWARLPADGGVLGKLKATVRTLPLRLSLAPADQARLDALLARLGTGA